MNGQFHYLWIWGIQSRCGSISITDLFPHSHPQIILTSYLQLPSHAWIMVQYRPGLISSETSLRPLVSVRPLVGCLVVFFSALSKKVFVVFVFKIPNYQDKKAKCLSQKCRVYPCSQLWRRRTRRRGVKITSRRLKGQLRLLFDTWITTDITTMTYSKTHHVFRYFHFNPNWP